jgi:hypothetical protein
MCHCRMLAHSDGSFPAHVCWLLSTELCTGAHAASEGSSNLPLRYRQPLQLRSYFCQSQKDKLVCLSDISTMIYHLAIISMQYDKSLIMISLRLVWSWSRLTKARLAFDVQFWTSDPRQSVPTRGALTRTVFAYCHHDIWTAMLHG